MKLYQHSGSRVAEQDVERQLQHYSRWLTNWRETRRGLWEKLLGKLQVKPRRSCEATRLPGKYVKS